VSDCISCEESQTVDTAEGFASGELKLGGLHEKHAVATGNLRTTSAFAVPGRKKKTFFFPSEPTQPPVQRVCMWGGGWGITVSSL
jgi:hypothetical protein